MKFINHTLKAMLSLIVNYSLHYFSTTWRPRGLVVMALLMCIREGARVAMRSGPVHHDALLAKLCAARLVTHKWVGDKQRGIKIMKHIW